MARALACRVGSTEGQALAPLEAQGGRAQAILGDPRNWAAVEAPGLVLLERRELSEREAGRNCREAAALVAGGDGRVRGGEASQPPLASRWFLQ